MIRRKEVLISIRFQGPEKIPSSLPLLKEGRGILNVNSYENHRTRTGRMPASLNNQAGFIVRCGAFRHVSWYEPLMTTPRRSFFLLRKEPGGIKCVSC